MADPIRVIVRVRPIEGESAWQVSTVDKTIQQFERNILVGKVYKFDRVFDQDARNIDIFSSVEESITKFMEGFNATIFAYGPTASGKTHTMMGDKLEKGVIPLSIDTIFDYIDRTPNRVFLLRISYMEIYNESINDLLRDDLKDNGSNLNIRESDGNVYVENLTEKYISDPDMVFEYLAMGEKYRRFGETKLNERSSRSHTIFRLTIESREKKNDSVQVSILNLVDLAGSERSSQTGAVGNRFKEGCNINKSLLVLSNVIRQLTERKGQFVSFRDSKLTRILQSSIGGNSKTAVICAVSPAMKYIEYVQSALRFASMVNKIENKPRINQILSDETKMKRMEQQIAELQTKLSISDGVPSELEKKLNEKSLENVELEKEIGRLRKLLMVSKEINLTELPVDHKVDLRRYSWCPSLINSGRKRLPSKFLPLPVLNESELSVNFEAEPKSNPALARASLPEELEGTPKYVLRLRNKELKNKETMLELSKKRLLEALDKDSVEIDELKLIHKCQMESVQEDCRKYATQIEEYKNQISVLQLENQKLKLGIFNPYQEHGYQSGNIAPQQISDSNAEHDAFDIVHYGALDCHNDVGVQVDLPEEEFFDSGGVSDLAENIEAQFYDPVNEDLKVFEDFLRCRVLDIEDISTLGVLSSLKDLILEYEARLAIFEKIGNHEHLQHFDRPMQRVTAGFVGNNLCNPVMSDVVSEIFPDEDLLDDSKESGQSECLSFGLVSSTTAEPRCHALKDVIKLDYNTLTNEEYFTDVTADAFVPKIELNRTMNYFNLAGAEKTLATNIGPLSESGTFEIEKADVVLSLDDLQSAIFLMKQRVPETSYFGTIIVELLEALLSHKRDACEHQCLVAESLEYLLIHVIEKSQGNVMAMVSSFLGLISCVNDDPSNAGKAPFGNLFLSTLESLLSVFQCRKVELEGISLPTEDFIRKLNEFQDNLCTSLSCTGSARDILRNDRLVCLKSVLDFDLSMSIDLCTFLMDAYPKLHASLVSVLDHHSLNQVMDTGELDMFMLKSLIAHYEKKQPEECSRSEANFSEVSFSTLRKSSQYAGLTEGKESFAGFHAGISPCFANNEQNVTFQCMSVVKAKLSELMAQHRLKSMQDGIGNVTAEFLTSMNEECREMMKLLELCYLSSHQRSSGSENHIQNAITSNHTALQIPPYEPIGCNDLNQLSKTNGCLEAKVCSLEILLHRSELFRASILSRVHELGNVASRLCCKQESLEVRQCGDGMEAPLHNETLQNQNVIAVPDVLDTKYEVLKSQCLDVIDYLKMLNGYSEPTKELPGNFGGLCNDLVQELLSKTGPFGRKSETRAFPFLRGDVDNPSTKRVVEDDEFSQGSIIKTSNSGLFDGEGKSQLGKFEKQNCQSKDLVHKDLLLHQVAQDIDINSAIQSVTHDRTCSETSFNNASRLGLSTEAKQLPNSPSLALEAEELTRRKPRPSLVAEQLTSSNLRSSLKAEQLTSSNLRSSLEAEQLTSSNLRSSLEAEQLANKGLKASLEAEQLANKGLKASLEAEQLANKGLKSSLEAEQLANKGFKSSLEAEQLANKGFKSSLEAEQLANKGLKASLEAEELANKDLKSSLEAEQLTSSNLRSSLEAEQLTSSNLRSSLEAEQLTSSNLQSSLEAEQIANKGLKSSMEVDQLTSSNLRSSMEADQLTSSSLVSSLEASLEPEQLECSFEGATQMRQTIQAMKRQQRECLGNIKIQYENKICGLKETFHLEIRKLQLEVHRLEALCRTYQEDCGRQSRTQHKQGGLVLEPLSKGQEGTDPYVEIDLLREEIEDLKNCLDRSVSHEKLLSAQVTELKERAEKHALQTVALTNQIKALEASHISKENIKPRSDHTSKENIKSRSDHIQVGKCGMVEYISIESLKAKEMYLLKEVEYYKTRASQYKTRLHQLRSSGVAADNDKILTENNSSINCEVKPHILVNSEQWVQSDLQMESDEKTSNLSNLVQEKVQCPHQ